MEDTKFKPFHETYKFIMFLLSIGMMYPNPATDKHRLIAIPLLCLSVTPFCLIVMYNIYCCWMAGDIVEMIRHTALVQPFLNGIVKLYMIYYKRDVALTILDVINTDYETFNGYNDKYKILVRSYIKNTLVYHYVWIYCVLAIFSVFVCITSGATAVSYMISAEPRKFMIHDVNLPFKPPGTQYETPYYEMMYSYLLYIALFCVVNTTAIDGFLIAALNHICLKVDIFSIFVSEAIECEGRELERKMAKAIRYQCDIYNFVSTIQSMFNDYLGLVYATAIGELCCCLYLMTESTEFDYKFTSFSTGVLLYIYVPCRICEKMKESFENAATQIYCSGWEDLSDLSVRRYIPFMIARAQSPVNMKAFGIITYELDLFVKTLKAAYSLYTLIKSEA